jgi:hypothetical protein
VCVCIYIFIFIYLLNQTSKSYHVAQFNGLNLLNSRDSSVSLVTRLTDERPRNIGWIPDTDPPSSADITKE